MSIMSKIAGLFGLSSHGPTDDFWYTRLLGGGPTASKIDVNEDSALNYSAVWAATRLLAGTAGWLPLNLYKRRPGGGRDVQRKDRRHRLVHSRPNEDMISMLFRSSLVSQQVNWGNGYAEIQRAGNMPVALWPIHPSRVAPFYDQNKKLFYEVKNNLEEPTIIPAKDILHFPSMMSRNGITGLGVIQAARESIGFGLATERHGANFFGSGAIPRIIISHPKRMDPESRDTFRREWKEIYGGSDGDQMALLPDGASVIPINITPEDSQFLSTRQHNVEEIARWYGVPPHMLQHLLRATFNNIEQLGIEFVVYSLICWLKIWEQELAVKLLTEAEQADWFFEFNVTALLRGDSKTRSEFYRSMATLGVFSLNEIRELENMNPIPFGEIHFIQGAMVPIEHAAKPPEPPPSLIDDDDDEVEEEDGGEKSEMSVDPAWVTSFIEQMETAKEAIVRLRGELAADRANGHKSAETDKREKMLAVAAKTMLTSACGRMVRKHAQAARQAANNPSGFLDWNDGFGDKVHDAFTKVLAPCIQAFTAIGIEANVDTIINQHLTEAHEDLLKAAEVTIDCFQESVEACVSGWEECRAQVLSDSVYQITIEGE